MIEVGDGVELDDGTLYCCWESVELEGMNYLCLISTENPTEICFAEQRMVDGSSEVQIVGRREKKIRIFDALKSKLESSQKEAPFDLESLSQD